MDQIPAFINGKAGTAERVIDLLRSDPRVAVRETRPEKLRESISDALEDDPPVVIVAGGDGTLSSAASVVTGTSTALAVVPAGTLNHFAQRIGVPTEPREALELAFTGATKSVDVGRVNGHLFLNTCIMGVYIAYVRRRDRIKPKIGYVASSAVAAVQTFFAMGNRRMDLQIDDGAGSRTSSLIFVGVGERDFRLPMLDGLMDAGRPGLHLVVVKPRRRAHLLTMVMRTAARGVRPWRSDEDVDSFLVDRFDLALRSPAAWAALDGELVQLSGRLTFRRDPGALLVRTPAG